MTTDSAESVETATTRSCTSGKDDFLLGPFNISPR